jgi:hypothetical protein
LMSRLESLQRVALFTLIATLTPSSSPSAAAGPAAGSQGAGNLQLLPFSGAAVDGADSCFSWVSLDSTKPVSQWMIL